MNTQTIPEIQTELSALESRRETMKQNPHSREQLFSRFPALSAAFLGERPKTEYEKVHERMNNLLINSARAIKEKK